MQSPLDADGNLTTDVVVNSHGFNPPQLQSSLQTNTRNGKDCFCPARSAAFL